MSARERVREVLHQNTGNPAHDTQPLEDCIEDDIEYDIADAILEALSIESSQSDMAARLRTLRDWLPAGQADARNLLEEAAQEVERLQAHNHCDHDPIECSYAALEGEYEEQGRKLKARGDEIERLNYWINNGLGRFQLTHVHSALRLAAEGAKIPRMKDG